ncbi:MAG: hypothetical protein AAB209_03500, partial [Bacteroidota bacterium]
FADYGRLKNVQYITLGFGLYVESLTRPMGESAIRPAKFKSPAGISGRALLLDVETLQCNVSTHSQMDSTYMWFRDT